MILPTQVYKLTRLEDMAGFAQQVPQGHPPGARGTFFHKPGRTSVKVAGFFYEVGRKRSGIMHTTVRAEGCAFIEMQRSSLIVLC